MCCTTDNMETIRLCVIKSLKLIFCSIDNGYITFTHKLRFFSEYNSLCRCWLLSFSVNAKKMVTNFMYLYRTEIKLNWKALVINVMQNDFWTRLRKTQWWIEAVEKLLHTSNTTYVCSLTPVKQYTIRQFIITTREFNSIEFSYVYKEFTV